MSPTEYKAFGPGADLWMTPSLGLSRWTSLMDWKCNLQISKSHFHESLKLNPQVQHIVESCGLPMKDVKTFASQSTLLIPSSDYLPNRWIAVSPPSSDENSFLNESLKIIKGLGPTKARVFLPKFVDATKAQSFFKKQNLDPIVDLISEEPHAGQ